MLENDTQETELLEIKNEYLSMMITQSMELSKFKKTTENWKLSAEKNHKTKEEKCEAKFKKYEYHNTTKTTKEFEDCVNKKKSLIKSAQKNQ